MNWTKKYQHKKIAYSIILIILIFLVIEITAFSIYLINPLALFPWQSYSKAFENLSTPKSQTGWDAYNDKPRPSGQIYPKECISVFGDSFSHADEVDDQEAWANLLAKSIKCQVNNFGVPGYGLDQAYLRYGRISPDSEIVIIGLYKEMLRRNFASSWLFYNQQKQTVLKPYFFISNGQLEREPYPEVSTIASFAKYHERDRFYQVFKVEFPYTFSTIKSSCFRLQADLFSHSNESASLPKVFVSQLCTKLNGRTLNEQILSLPFNDKDSTDLALQLIENMQREVVGKGKKFVILFFPNPDDISGTSSQYENFLNDIKLKIPDTCIINPAYALEETRKSSGHSLRAPKGHFDNIGNRVIADEVKRSLNLCGLLNK